MSEEVSISEAQDELGSNLEPTPASKRAKAKAKVKDTSDRIWIQLEENEDIPPTGLFLGHNGNGYLIEAGKPVHVPPHIVEILDHAVITVPQVDPTTRRVIGHRERMRFPYRRVSAPEAGE